MGKTDNVDLFVDCMKDDQKEILKICRGLVREIAPDAHEEIKWGALVFFSDRPFCGLMPYSKYVSVIFDRGAEIEDSDGLLEGGGKAMRHLKIRQQGDITAKKVRDYIARSYGLQT
jgi:hypothetical protein